MDRHFREQINQKTSESCFIFSSGWNPLSNFYPSPFVVQGRRFRTAQHYYQYLKAEAFGDVELCNMMLQEPSPKAVGDMATVIKDFNEVEWNTRADEAMKKALRAKFSACVVPRRFLVGTGTTKIIFATRHQTYWGNGLDYDDEMNPYPDSWEGVNKLGEMLMELREQHRATTAAGTLTSCSSTR